MTHVASRKAKLTVVVPGANYGVPHTRVQPFSFFRVIAGDP